MTFITMQSADVIKMCQEKTKKLEGVLDQWRDKRQNWIAKRTQDLMKPRMFFFWNTNSHNLESTQKEAADESWAVITYPVWAYDDMIAINKIHALAIKADTINISVEDLCLIQ